MLGEWFMFCEYCGKQLPDGAKFCSGCGNSVRRDAEAIKVEEPVVENYGATEVLQSEEENFGATEILQPEIYEEPKAYVEPSLTRVATEPCIDVYSQPKIKAANPAKTASICAIFAPVSIFIASILNFFVTELFLQISRELMGSYDKTYIFWQQFGYFLSGALCLGVYIGVYLIFTGRYRKELPFFLFLLAPGCSALISWMANLFYGFVYLIPLEYDMLEVLLVMVRFVFAFAQATVSYFVVRGVFKKILSSKA